MNPMLAMDACYALQCSLIMSIEEYSQLNTSAVYRELLCEYDAPLLHTVARKHYLYKSLVHQERKGQKLRTSSAVLLSNYARKRRRGKEGALPCLWHLRGLLWDEP